jgi:HEAT repeat protein
MYRSALTLRPRAWRRFNPQLCREAALWALGLIAAGCASAPPISPPVLTFEDKLAAMIRLEDARILRDPNPPAPRVLQAATGRRPAIVAPAPPSDLLRLMTDPEARVRRRAALAAGRVGMAAALDPLSKLLGEDEDAEVRQMAAFALGLIGHPGARPALLGALAQPSAVVQGRAAEALGRLGDRSDAAAVSAMIQAHVKAGVLASIGPDDLAHPLAPQVEAVRLGLYALVRLGDYPALAAAALDASGQPVSRWWPVAFAFQRLGDAKGAPVLTTLLATEGRYTASFAARGLGAMKAGAATEALLRIAQERRRHPAVVVQAVRALAAMGDRRAAPILTAILADPKADATLRLEVVTAMTGLRPRAAIDLLLDLLSDPSPPMRAAAMRALAATDADTFVTALSGLDPDRDWTVRAAQAAALGTLDAERGVPRLTAMLKDTDQRVVPAVLTALAALKAPDAGQVLQAHLTAEDFAVRAAAAAGLGELKVASAVPALIAAFRAAQSEPPYAARASALAALVKIDRAAAQPVIDEALRDRDWAVRRRALALLRETDNQNADAAEAIRPAPPGRAVSDAERAWMAKPPFSPHAYIETERGTIELELAVLDAPLAVASFMDLARRGFFSGVAIHRVVPDFVVQDGDPRGDGEGGPGYTLRDEINQRPYLRGTVGMALDWEDTGGSQFFITHAPQPHLDGRYTVIGYVVNGMEIADRIEPRDVIKGIRIWDGINP